MSDVKIMLIIGAAIYSFYLFGGWLAIRKERCYVPIRRSIFFLLIGVAHIVYLSVLAALLFSIVIFQNHIYVLSVLSLIAFSPMLHGYFLGRLSLGRTLDISGNFSKVYFVFIPILWFWLAFKQSKPERSTTWHSVFIVFFSFVLIGSGNYIFDSAMEKVEEVVAERKLQKNKI